MAERHQIDLGKVGVVLLKPPGIDPGYRCAGCDEINDSCRIVGCPATTEREESDARR